jgi:hypothetical protein
MRNTQTNYSKIEHTLLCSMIALLFFVISAPPVDAVVNSLWNGANGNWTDAIDWSSNPNYPNNGGGVKYNATIPAGSVALNRNIRIEQFVLTGGSLLGGFDLTLNQGMTWTAGTLGNTGTLTLMAGSSSTFGTVGSFTDLPLSGRTINNSGAITLSGDSVVGTNAIFNNLAGATVEAQGGKIFDYYNAGNSNSTFNNFGSFIVNDLSGGEHYFTVFNNTGGVATVESGTLGFAAGTSSGGQFEQTGGRLLFFNSNPALGYTLGDGSVITGSSPEVLLGYC